MSWLKPRPTKRRQLQIRLFVAQGFDWVEARGFGGRPDAEDQADADRNREADDDGPGGHHGFQRADHGNQEDDGAADDNADDAAGSGEGHGFEEELPGDVATARADGFTHTNFASALGDGHQHDVHHAHAADEQADGTEHHDDEHHAANDVVEFLDDFHLGLNREVVRLVVRNFAAAAQNFTELIHGGIELAGICQEAIADLVGCGVQVSKNVIGDGGAAIFIVRAGTLGRFFKPGHD